MRIRPASVRFRTPVRLARFVARVALVAMLLATGCRVTVTGGIDVSAKGTGTVRAGLGLDDEALQAVGDLGSQLAVDDLRRAGWTVSPPRKEGDGLTWVRASLAFSDIAGAQRGLAQLSGPEGPFRDLAVGRSKSLLHTRTTLSGVVDLSHGLAGLGDPDLQARIGGAFPLDLDQLRNDVGPDADRNFKVRFEASLPGSVDSDATLRVGGREAWQPTLGGTAAVRASSQSLNPLAVGGIAALLLLVVAAAAVLVYRRVRR